MAEKLNQKDFKEFEKLFNQVRRANREERLDAVGTLSPKSLREHLKSGQDLVLAYGRKGHTVTYTLSDLQQFEKAIKKAKSSNRPERSGVPVMQLERSSLQEDKLRMQTQIRNATLYKVRDNILHFQVSASGKSGKSHHQVRVRLEDWYDHMTDNRTWLAGARLAAVGKISFDCSCGRHQYWYRYLATIGNYALTPKEKDFPKIRNPKLTGACCKHVLKVLQQLKSASVHSILAKHLKSQADSIGYADKKGAKFLSPKDLAKAQRARGSGKESAEAQRAYEDFKAARKAFKKKIKTQKSKQEMEKLQKAMQVQVAKNAALQARNRKLKQQAERDQKAAGIRVFLDTVKKYGVPREQAIKDYSEQYKMDKKEVESIVEEYKL